MELNHSDRPAASTIVEPYSIGLLLHSPNGQAYLRHQRSVEAGMLKASGWALVWSGLQTTIDYWRLNEAAPIVSPERLTYAAIGIGLVAVGSRLSRIHRIEQRALELARHNGGSLPVPSDHEKRLGRFKRLAGAGLAVVALTAATQFDSQASAARPDSAAVVSLVRDQSTSISLVELHHASDYALPVSSSLPSVE